MTLVWKDASFFNSDVPFSFVKEMRTRLSEDERTQAVLLLFPIAKEQLGKLPQVDFNPETNEVRNVVEGVDNCTLPYTWGAIMYKSHLRNPEQSIMTIVRGGWKVKVVVVEN